MRPSPKANWLFLHKLDRLLILTAMALLPACASFMDHREAAFVRAQAGGFATKQIKVGDFELVTFHRGLAGAQSVVVYIEGDGRVARTRTQLSKDPTPRQPVALRLALADPSLAVLYVARPCQYLSEEQLALCSPRYWALARYADEVIAATSQVVDWALAKTNNPGARLGLVGYSGGGAVAALVAARRDDVDWLVTVAGNLDHEKWTEMHELTPLVDSLNPADFTRFLEHIPQLHLVGGEDKNIPRTVAQSFFRAFVDPSNVTVETVPDFTHHCCWTSTWPALLCRFSPAASSCGSP